MSSLLNDYIERLYAPQQNYRRVSRSLEGWLYDKIMNEFGEAWHYIRDKLNKPPD